MVSFSYMFYLGVVFFVFAYLKWNDFAFKMACIATNCAGCLANLSTKRIFALSTWLLNTTETALIKTILHHFFVF